MGGHPKFPIMPWPGELTHSFLCYFQNWARGIFSSWDHSVLWPYNKRSIPDKPQVLWRPLQAAWKWKVAALRTKCRFWFSFLFSFFNWGKVCCLLKQEGEVKTKQSWIMEQCGGTYPLWMTPSHSPTHRMLPGLHYEAGNGSKNHTKYIKYVLKNLISKPSCVTQQKFYMQINPILCVYSSEFVGPPLFASICPGATGTPQCHDVITAVGAEPFGPWGRLICCTETSSVGRCGQSAPLKMACSPWLPPHKEKGFGQLYAFGKWTVQMSCNWWDGNTL